MQNNEKIGNFAIKSSRKMKIWKYVAITLISISLLSCGGTAQKRTEEEINTVEVACDETFRPIMEQEMRAFHAKYPEAILDTTFVSETKAIQLLLEDSFRMAITTRPLSQVEQQSILNNYRLTVESHPCAELKGNLKTAKSNPNVITYVQQTRNAIGIIGVDWIRNFKDTTNLSFDDRVRVMRVSNSSIAEESNSFQPVQYYIATGDYPLIRRLYISSTEPYIQALNRNFYHYLTDTEGQLIITKSSQLLPIVPVHVKQVDIK